MSATFTRSRFGATGESRVARCFPLLLCSIFIIAAATLPLPGQPHATFIQNNRFWLVRQAPDIYRPWFGPIGSAAPATPLDSLRQRGFDPDIDLFGNDTSIIRFVDGEFQIRHEGRTELVVRYPVYPEYLDTVGVLVQRDADGWEVTLEHRPVFLADGPIEVDRWVYRSERDMDLDWTFQIVPKIEKGKRKFYSRTSTVGNTLRSLAHDLRTWYLPPGMKRRVPRILVSVSMYPGNHYDTISFRDYDSTIIRFEGDEIVPLRPGVTEVTIDYPVGRERAKIEVDRKMSVRLLETYELDPP